MEFKYKAMKPNGDIVEGIFIADAKTDVVEMLKSKNNYPITIDEKRNTGTKEITLRQTVGSRELAFFCRQLNAMLHAGSTIKKSLEIMKAQLTNRVLKNAVSEMLDEVQKGKMLSETMKSYPKIFPELMIYMVESGEVSGSLDTILLRLATYFDKDAKLKSRIRSAMVYPIILAVMCVAVVIFMSLFIMPTFVSMFEKSDVPLPGITRFLLNVSVIIKERWFVVLLVIGIIVLVIIQYINSENGRRVADKLKLRIPIVKGVNVNIVTARFSRNLSTMLSSGVPLLTALDNLSNVIGNRVVGDAIIEYKEKIQKGTEFHVAIKESHIFPPMLDGMVEIGKESGTLDDILEKTANYYEDEVDTSIQRLVALFEPFMILLMAFVVGFIVVAMALPMFDMFQTLQ